ncbi:hypothetical protein FKP32DRAFT_1578784 [Trametes sanguinea]|nr:hypothetical protein FKP32DRAFT_1578784 [Trametes sanguinea]
MGRIAWDSPFDDASIPTPEEVEAFDPRKGPCCTAKNLRPDLTASSGTPWNVSVTNTFVADFVEAKVYPQASRVQVAKAFRTHLGRLRSYYRDCQKGGVSPKTQKARNSAERRRNLFSRRLKAARSHAPLEQHVEMLRILGPKGMSSDESAHENGVVQYRVLKKPWRADQVTVWLRTLDAIYRRDRFSPVNGATRGAVPHLRLTSNRVSTRTPPPPGLPINAFKPSWLSNLADFDREMLKISDEPYEFTHTTDVTL